MGVCCVLHAVRDATIDAVLADPPLVWRVIDPDDDTAYFREIGFGLRRSWFARMLGPAPAQPDVRSLSFLEHELLTVDLDKSWDGLAACLERCRPDVLSLFKGGETIGKIEVGYGPATGHRCSALAQIAEACLSIQEAELLEAFRAADMRKRYLGNFWKRSDDDAASYLVENFAELQRFLLHTREHALGAIIQYT